MTAVQDRAAVRYDFEADMLPALAAAADLLVKGLPAPADRVVMFEVPTFESIPDLVIAQLDQGLLYRREQAGLDFVADITTVRTLHALVSGVTHVDGLADQAGVSAAHLRRSVLPRLAAAGWVDAAVSGRGVQVRLLHEWQPVVRWVVTVEAKRSKWREAVAQARRHQRVADRAFVALDAASANPARAWSEELSQQGIGLVTLDARTDEVTVERRPRRFGRRDYAARGLLGERMAALAHSGRNVGRTFPVFGQVLPMSVTAPGT